MFLYYLILKLKYRAPVFDTLEIIFASLFSIDYSWGLYNAKNKKKFVLQT